MRGDQYSDRPFIVRFTRTAYPFGVIDDGWPKQTWRYRSRDVALARVTAIFFAHPDADLNELAVCVTDHQGIVISPMPWNNYGIEVTFDMRAP